MSLGAGEVRPAEVCVPELGVGEIRPGEVRIAEVHVAEVHAGQVHAGEVSAEEVSDARAETSHVGICGDLADEASVLDVPQSPDGRDRASACCLAHLFRRELHPSARLGPVGVLRGAVHTAAEKMLGVGEGKPWGEAIRSALIAEPDRWFSAVELVDRYAHLIPPEDIRRRAGQRKQHRSSSADRSAASTIIGGVIYTAIRRGHFERRQGVDGRLEVRASRTLGETGTAGRRMLADAGLMTLAEASAAIGVSHGQVGSVRKSKIVEIATILESVTSRP